jgi:hypothetical protein
VNGSAATSDLIKIALALLQAGAARGAPQSIQNFARVAITQFVAALCATASLGCALGALRMYAAPILGDAGALLVDAGVLGVISLAALGLARRAGKQRSQSPSLGSGGNASLAGAVSLFKQHTGLALTVALLAGVFLGGES